MLTSDWALMVTQVELALKCYLLMSYEIICGMIILGASNIISEISAVVQSVSRDVELKRLVSK